MNSKVRITMDDKATNEEKETAKRILEKVGLSVELDKGVYVRKS